MGTIQSSVNAMLGTVAAGAAAGKHIKQQQLNIEAANAADQEIVETTKAAIKNDTIEATAAIAAHEPEFAEKVKDYDLQNLDEDEVNELREEVEAFREGKLTEDRIQRIKDASEYKGAKSVRKGMLNKAYDAFRELNDRISASRQLKFNLESAQARLQARGVK